MSLRPDTAKRNKSRKMRGLVSESWKHPAIRAARASAISTSMKGNTNGRFRAGVKHTLEAIERMRVAHLGQKAWNKGTGAPEKELDRIRHSKKYNDWRTKVFRRDKYTCQHCGQRGGRIEADHIKPFSRFPKLRFILSNGRTLCRPCHKKTPTYGYKAKTYKLP